MTAGLVHLVAPGAHIMSLKAFAGDGSSDLFNIVRAIYYAADNGANVISMSFEIAQGSPALQNAIQYALSKNVVVVAASGNDGGQILVFPSAYNSVIGVGSTSNSDAKSSFHEFRHQFRIHCRSRRRRDHDLSGRKLCGRLGNVIQHSAGCRRSGAGFAGAAYIQTGRCGKCNFPRVLPCSRWDMGASIFVLPCPASALAAFVSRL